MQKGADTTGVKISGREQSTKRQKGEKKQFGYQLENDMGNFKLRKYQSEAINSIFNYFLKGNRGNPLVVAPTGSGKSIIIADLCKQVITKWPGQKILVISHVKEILEQNYSKLKEHIKNSKIGLYSSGLKSKTISDITVAGIQSIYNKPELFDAFDIIIVDEAHTIPHTRGGRYHKFFEQVTKPVIGFTATPYRLGQGYLHKGDGAFFADIVYDIEIKELQHKGYLCPVSNKNPDETFDATGVKKQAGDFVLKELSIAFDREQITSRIVDELLKFKDIRKKWLLFAIDIDHCENITDTLNTNGIKAASVHSRMEGNRATIIDMFKSGHYQALVSVAVLTTGFDVPAVDLIGLLRPTASPTLHVQIIGRGLRISEETGKKDCLVLDFAGNLLRNGPIDNPVVKTPGKGGGEAVMKICPNCSEIVHAAVRVCSCCKYEFKFQHHLSEKSESAPVLSEDLWHHVDDVEYKMYTGTKGIPMLKVRYICGLRVFSEYICIEHNGYALHKAKFWWGKRTTRPVPETAYEAVEDSKYLDTPTEIQVNEGGKFANIIGYNW